MALAISSDEVDARIISALAGFSAPVGGGSSDSSILDQRAMTVAAYNALGAKVATTLYYTY